MMTLRLTLAVLWCSMLPLHAQAQISDTLPDESTLQRFGLTLAWWGQSVINGHRDTILHVTADEHNLYVQSTSGIVTTFDAENGRRLWSGLVGRPDQRGFQAVSNDEELLVATGMQVYSFDKNTGELIWQLRSPEHPSTSPSVSEDQVAIGCIDGSVFTFDLRKVHELHRERMLPEWTHLAQQWKFKTPLRVVSPPIFSGPSIIFASEHGSVYGLSAGNKAFRFQFETDAKIHTPLGSSEDYVLVTDDDSRLFCLNKLNGRIRWTFSSGAPMKEAARFVGQHVYVAPTREGLYALTIVSGRALWRQPRATAFVAASDSRVYASDVSGNLLILDRENGEILGSLGFRPFPIRIANERTDRIFIANQSGLVLTIREIDSDFPVFHLHPERRPILPLMGPADEQADGSTAPADTPADDNENPFQN